MRPSPNETLLILILGYKDRTTILDLIFMLQFQRPERYICNFLYMIFAQSQVVWSFFFQGRHPDLKLKTKPVAVEDPSWRISCGCLSIKLEIEATELDQSSSRRFEVSLREIWLKQVLILDFCHQPPVSCIYYFTMWLLDKHLKGHNTACRSLEFAVNPQGAIPVIQLCDCLPHILKAASFLL